MVVRVLSLDELQLAALLVAGGRSYTFICIFIHHPPVDHIINVLPLNKMEHEMQIHDKKTCAAQRNVRIRGKKACGDSKFPQSRKK